MSREPILSNGTLGVINHGIGNIRSLTNALDYLDFQYRIITQVHDAANLEAIILPGVGNFGAVMKAIEDSGLKEMLKDHLTAGEPFWVFASVCRFFSRAAQKRQESQDLASSMESCIT